MINIKILNKSDNPLPTLQTKGSACVDIAINEDCHVKGPGEILKVRTGLYMEIPEGYEGVLKLRSSSGNKGLIMPNAPATIDSDYRGEIRLQLTTIQDEGWIFLEKGDRIAQMEFRKVEPFVFEEVSDISELSETDRGAKGFGSTGDK